MSAVLGLVFLASPPEEEDGLGCRDSALIFTVLSVGLGVSGADAGSRHMLLC